MIKLDLMEYCQDCPCFEAEINAEEYRSMLSHIEKHTIISCKNAEKCGVLLNYLKGTTDIYRLVRKSQI